MIDFDDILSYVRLYYRAAIGILIILALALFFWLFKGYGGNPEVKQTISEIKQTAEANERRADDIVEAVKAKEVNARNETLDMVSSSSDDALPDMLSGLLRDYRRENGR